ncbi:flagellar biosynthesis protein FliS [Thermosipho melanesiensis]|uniref:Flagellar secretion chaperone FliS n=2 Tax=Thermosipho melanesiensis TaxID=46541 RepID=A6LKH3_THEM4|nr:flagellar export chaperone FliS [Thermosipho melanesiensis]ABR30424.1 flagellar protein FliS [Thermosipho melanesiensis BI429]APT73584.1 flagellar biosynthesis protein FliS [Thermosipho melanesiensis]OOC37532.1 flagellar biosynthesis protein FliS [Thermosipho melanesiensis]OOC39428.1 flagellar biosynthesis protein FliS [Thermosipho melanesiensis]OOC39491.1 flagellar biosynthesis protein FliS [Thermosipho melanesiensis]
MDYTEQMVKTASPAKLIEMLYQRAIELLDMSVESINKKDFINANEYIKKCQDIITELNLSLDMEKGGDIAKNLRSLYNYMFKVLVDANIKKDTSKIKEVREYLSELLETWREAMKNVGNTANQLPDPNRPRLNISL